MVLRIFSTAQKDRRTLRVVSQYTSEADLFDLLRLDLASRFRLTLSIPYVQAAILIKILLIRWACLPQICTNLGRSMQFRL